MSARYVRGGWGTSMYQWLHPAWMGMSRTTRSDVLVVSCEVTSVSRRTGRAPCQSCPRAASARWTACTDSSQQAWSQNGSETISQIWSLTAPPFLVFADKSLSTGMTGSSRGAGLAGGLAAGGLAGGGGPFAAGLAAGGFSTGLIRAGGFAGPFAPCPAVPLTP